MTKQVSALNKWFFKWNFRSEITNKRKKNKEREAKLKSVIFDYMTDNWGAA